MTLTELRYAVTIARTKNYRRASEVCGVSTPTMSVAIKKLEDGLGAKVFSRDTHGVQLTNFGEQFVEMAARVLDEAEVITQIAQSNQDPIAGNFKLGVIHTVGPTVMPILARSIRSMAPQMTLTMQEGLTSNLMDHLMKGSLDAAVVALPVNGNGIMARDLYEESFVVAMPKGHAWANRGSIDQAELQGERVLLMAHGHCMREDVLAACPGVVAGRDATSRNRAALTAEGTTLETLRYMVESDMGIAILPKSYALRFSNDDALAIVPLSKTASCRRIGIVWRSSFNRPQAIEALVSAIAHSQLKGVEMLAAIQASNLH